METRKKVGNDCGKREGKKEGRQDRDGRIDSSGCFSNLLLSTFASFLPRSIMELRISPPPYYIVRK